MIATLRGNLLYSDLTSLIVECGGVGFKCTTTSATLGSLPNIGDEIFLYTYMAVREDAMDLFGFSTVEEMEAFKMIISVNGVGPKIGIALLSEFTPSQLYLYIGSNDAKALTSANGVGIKLAQRIVLELKDKVEKIGYISSADLKPKAKPQKSTSDEAVAALMSLGYTKGEASLAVGKIEEDLPTDELIKQALKLLARGL
ncbi:MAG: Holliday junction branch migration protein RuvA [Clostridia bacterium]|nr:Holliday junction branch migration protein RuvA [Clostridia bacterium]